MKQSETMADGPLTWRIDLISAPPDREIVEKEIVKPVPWKVPETS